MKQVKHKKRWIALAIEIVLLAAAIVIGYLVWQEMHADDVLVRYSAAITDAVTVESEEILPLKTTLDAENAYALWDEAGEQLLLCTWNDTPGDYPDGSASFVGDEPVWVFSGAELADWYEDNSLGVNDWELRLCQLIGLPPETGYTHMTTMWVDADDLYRPAYVSDPTDSAMTTELTGDDWFVEWFEMNNASTYGEDGYPWTRLGYTYDWAKGSGEYGLTEFIIRPGAEITVEKTLSTDDFLSSLRDAER